ncbi:MAG: DUF3299 domain-containing protein [Gammaproteobacteria bacterium]|nr:DUF3299 domain-containing protein [Gammaproteobacteria bacterium]
MSERLVMAAVHWFLVLLFAVPAFAQVQGYDDEGTAPLSGLTAEELAAEPPASAIAPVKAADATDLRIEVLAEIGYVDEQGRYVVDLLQQDFAYLAVRVETAQGQPVVDAAPAFSIEGTSLLLEPHEVSPRATTDEDGVVEFAVVGGQMGLDRVEVKVGEASTELLVNVISLQAAGFPMPPVVEGGLSWQDLMQARIRYEEMMLVADFPEAVAERTGQTVKLSGFMMPLEPDLKQFRFLLTSNPPSCFFHVPGGPAGAVEVLANKGIEVSWNPVVLEGRFEPQRQSEIGVVYRLLDARLVTP